MKKVALLLGLITIALSCNKTIEVQKHQVVGYLGEQNQRAKWFVIDVFLKYPEPVPYNFTFGVVVYNSEYPSPDHTDTVDQVVTVPANFIRWQWRDTTTYYDVTVQKVYLEHYEPAP